jgi:hypothetical protein
VSTLDAQPHNNRSSYREAVHFSIISKSTRDFNIVSNLFGVHYRIQLYFDHPTLVGTVITLEIKTFTPNIVTQEFEPTNSGALRQFDYKIDAVLTNLSPLFLDPNYYHYFPMLDFLAENPRWKAPHYLNHFTPFLPLLVRDFPMSLRVVNVEERIELYANRGDYLYSEEPLMYIMRETMRAEANLE